MGRAVPLPCWLFFLPVGPQIWSLQTHADSANGDFQENTCWGTPPGLLLPVSLSTWIGIHALTHASISASTSKSDSVSCGVAILSLGPDVFVCFVFALQVWNLFLPVLWKFCRRILLAFKADSGKILSLFVGSQAGKPGVRSQNPSKLWEDFFGIILYS